jgi:hypothetical protein
MLCIWTTFTGDERLKNLLKDLRDGTKANYGTCLGYSRKYVKIGVKLEILERKNRCKANFCAVCMFVCMYVCIYLFIGFVFWYFLYLHFKCCPPSWFPLCKPPIPFPLPLSLSRCSLTNQPTPASPPHPSILRHGASKGPKASPLTDAR